MSAVEPVKQTGKVKIQTLRAINTGTAKEPHIVEPGQTIEVTEEQAQLFCDTKFDGGRAYVGERFNDDPRHEIVRAKRV